MQSGESSLGYSSSVTGPMGVRHPTPTELQWDLGTYSCRSFENLSFRIFSFFPPAFSLCPPSCLVFSLLHLFPTAIQGGWIQSAGSAFHPRWECLRGEAAARLYRQELPSQCQWADSPVHNMGLAHEVAARYVTALTGKTTVGCCFLVVVSQLLN